MSKNAKEILQIRCSHNAEATRELQELALMEVKQFIQNYCNVSSVCSELAFVWANMAYDLLMGSYISHSNQPPTGAIKPNEVTSMSVGDMSVTRSADLISHKISLDDLILNYSSQLNKFRRMKWSK